MGPSGGLWEPARCPSYMAVSILYPSKQFLYTGATTPPFYRTPVDIPARGRRARPPKPFWPRNGTGRDHLEHLRHRPAQNFKPELPRYVPEAGERLFFDVFLKGACRKFRGADFLAGKNGKVRSRWPNFGHQVQLLVPGPLAGFWQATGRVLAGLWGPRGAQGAPAPAGPHAARGARFATWQWARAAGQHLRCSLHLLWMCAAVEPGISSSGC